MTAFHPAAHGTFVIERRYEASPARVFQAHADPVAFRRWFVEGKGFTIFDWGQDFSIGGRMHGRFRFGDESNPVIFNETRFLDITPDRRIIVAYVMGYERADGPERFSTSLATTELFADGAGTRLVYTEQGAYFGEDGVAHIPNREHGCRAMLEALAGELDRR